MSMQEESAHSQMNGTGPTRPIPSAASCRRSFARRKRAAFSASSSGVGPPIRGCSPLPRVQSARAAGSISREWLREALGGWVGAIGLQDEDLDGDVGLQADLREEGAHLPAKDLLDGRDETRLHRPLEGKTRLRDRLRLAAVEQRPLDRAVDVFENAH